MSEIKASADVPDAVALLDEDGNVIGWDESLANAYIEPLFTSSKWDQ